MKPMTLFLLDPPPGDVEAGLSEGRVAAVFTSAEKRQAARLAFAAKAGELVDLDAGNLRPFMRASCALPQTGDRARGALIDAALAFVGVPRTVVVTSEDLFGIVTDALRRGPRSPRALKFKGWSEARREDLARLGFSNVAVVGAPPEGPGTGLGAGGAAAAGPFGGCTFHAWR